MQEYVIDTSKVDTESGWNITMLDDMKKDIATKFQQSQQEKQKLKDTTKG